MAEEEKHDRKQDKPSQEYQNFQRLLEGTLAVPKEELGKRRDEYGRKWQERGK